MKPRSLALFALGAFVSALIAVFPSPATALEGEVVVPIEASQFSYAPKVVDVSLGQRVVLELNSADVVHGIYLDGYDLAVEADPGQTALLSFIADQTGSFRFRCSVTCGPLHPFMIGQLNVNPHPKGRRIVAGGLAALFLGVAMALRNET
jgi:heme/copper-type cytochrome/quinol oxidase subunit 2